LKRRHASGHDFNRAASTCCACGFSRWPFGVIVLCLTVTSALAQQSGPRPAFIEPSGSFFALSVKDLTATAAWYQQRLGFKQVKQGAARDGKSRSIVLDRDGVVLELIHHKDAVDGSKLRKDYKPYLIYGVFKIGLIVQDADHTLQRLKENGVQIANGPWTDQELHMRSFFIRDNEGNIIQFL